MLVEKKTRVGVGAKARAKARTRFEIGGQGRINKIKVKKLLFLIEILLIKSITIKTTMQLRRESYLITVK